MRATRVDTATVRLNYFREAQVFQRLGNHDDEAFAALAEDHRERANFDRVALPHLDAVFGAAVYLTADPDRASDLVQETFLRAFRFFYQFEPGTNCRAWLLTILQNTFRNRYRAEQRNRGNIDIDDQLAEAEATLASEVDNDPETLVLGSLLDHEVDAALSRLPEVFRSVVVLVVVLIDLEELTYDEAAKVLGCPIGTIRSRLSRARASLERELCA